MIDKYPPSEMELNVFYVKRDGKSVWVKIKEGGGEAWID